MLSARTTGACARPRATSAAPVRPIVAGARRSSVVVRAAAEADSTTSGIEKTGPSFKPVLDIEAIKGVLPHR
jgi:hypothetical protein